VINKTIAKVWTFASSSNPNKSYETLQYTDGSTSCQCPGWTRRVAPDGSRSCKHTDMVTDGTADQNCKSMVDYAAKSSTAKVKKTAVKVEQGLAAPARRIEWQ
jgi:hypothetical protein